MPVYTFLDSYDFSDKINIPFSTGGGSGLSGTEQRLSMICKNSKLLQGFTISGRAAQSNRAESEKRVTAWLTKIDLFEVMTVKPYAVDYTECTVEAKEELRNNSITQSAYNSS